MVSLNTLELSKVKIKADEVWFLETSELFEPISCLKTLFRILFHVIRRFNTGRISCLSILLTSQMGMTHQYIELTAKQVLLH